MNLMGPHHGFARRTVVAAAPQVIFCVRPRQYRVSGGLDMFRAAFHRRLIAWPLLAVGLVSGSGRAQDVVPPRSVKVLPVFFVPKGEVAPTDEQSKRLVKHLEW